MTWPGYVDRMLALGIGVPMRTDGTEPCIGLTHLYFPDRTKPLMTKLATKRAIELCQTCHRTEECLRLARERGETDGVWGGVSFWTPKDRDRAREPSHRSASG